MSSILNKLLQLALIIKLEVSALILEGAKNLFDQNPNLSSFGWYQASTSELTNEETYESSSSLGYPDVNGNDGSRLIYSDDAHLQSKVTEFLSQFNLELLFMTYGRNVEVAFYRPYGGSSNIEVETHDYDYYGTDLEEL